MSTDFIFLIIRIIKEDQQHVEYSLGGNVAKQNINMQIEDDVKRQISEHYKVASSSVTRSAPDGQEFILTFDDTLPPSSSTASTTTTTITTPTTTAKTTTSISTTKDKTTTSTTTTTD